MTYTTSAHIEGACAANPTDAKVWSFGATAVLVAGALPSQPGFVFTFDTGPSFAPERIGLSVELADGIAFRSGSLPALPAGIDTDPNDFVDILCLDAIIPNPLVTQADLTKTAAGLTAGGEFPLGSTNFLGSTVTLYLDGVTLTLKAGALAVAGTGRVRGVPKPWLSTVTFTFSVTLSAAPETSVADTSTLVAFSESSPAVTFAPLKGFDPQSILESVLLNAIAAFATGPLASDLASLLQAKVNNAITGGTTGQGVPNSNCPIPALPAGVVLTVRNLTIAPSGIKLAASLGSFGSIIPKLAPAISVGPSSLDFQAPVGGTDSKELVISNTGSFLPLQFCPPLPGPSAPFSFDSSLFVSVCAGQSLSLGVAFEPTTVGVFPGSITMNTNSGSIFPCNPAAPPDRASVPLSGSASRLQPTLVADPASLFLPVSSPSGPVPPDSAKITNQGSDAVRITAVSDPLSLFKLTDANGNALVGAVIQPFQSVTVRAGFVSKPQATTKPDTLLVQAVDATVPSTTVLPSGGLPISVSAGTYTPPPPIKGPPIPPGR